MRNRVPDEATCAVCGRHFDPTETRGWCPNPSCGEWQHPSFPVEGDRGGAGGEPDAETEAEAEAAEPTKACPDCGNEVGIEARFCEHCAYAFDGEEASSTGGETEDDDADGLRCPDCDFDLSDIPPEQLSICPVCMYDVTPLLEEDEEAAAEEDRAELTTCPNCGEDLTPIPRDLRTVCPGCRIDLDDAGGAPAADPGSSAADETTDSADSEEVPIEAVDAIEAGYGPQLEEAGVATLGDLTRANVEELSAQTGISTKRIEGWVEEATVEQPDTEPEAEPQPGDDPGELVLEVEGREVSVVDGQTVGGEIRSAMVEAGASEEEAVYVHRKHVRFDAADGEFFLTRLGENALAVNGHPVEQGERIPIRDGDEITFSDVVDVGVSVR